MTASYADSVTFDTDGQWDVPDGVTEFTVHAWAGGGDTLDLKITQIVLNNKGSGDCRDLTWKLNGPLNHSCRAEVTLMA